MNELIPNIISMTKPKCLTVYTDLLTKSYMYGIEGVVYNWVMYFSKDREQYVCPSCSNSNTNMKVYSNITV